MSINFLQVEHKYLLVCREYLLYALASLVRGVSRASDTLYPRGYNKTIMPLSS